MESQPANFAQSNGLFNGRSNSSAFDGDDVSWAVAATDPRHPWHEQHEQPARSRSLSLDEQTFIPAVPNSFRNAGISATQVESLILKFIHNAGVASCRDVCEQHGLPYGMMEKLLQSMKYEQLIAIKSEARLGDFSFELTPFGCERARRYALQSTYFGTAPVPVEHYAYSVHAQSISQHTLNPTNVRLAYADLVLDDSLIMRLGEALNLGLGMFIYGAPGNGKSSIAERVVAAYSPHIWIPRAISVGGEILRLYDPIHHQEVPVTEDEGIDTKQVDQRWVRIRRPAILVGGELDLSSFGVTTNTLTNISEAPLTLKSNCGVLIIDDFGRNGCRPEELLNRLVVPLERRNECLHLDSGRTFRVPFDSMVVLSSNIDPLNLVDEALLRRIPFKIDVPDPTEDEFREVFRMNARRLKLEFNESDITYLLTRHFCDGTRHRRFCQPRDILRAVRNACDFHSLPCKVTPELIDSAVASIVAIQAPQIEV